MACRVDAVPRGLPPGRSHRLLGPVESGAAGLRTGGGRLGRAPSPTRRSGPGRPIRASWPASPRAVSATLRHAARLLLHAAHGPLLPGAPICSSSSRPLLVALVVVVAVVVVSLLLLLLPGRRSAALSVSSSRSLNPGPEEERDGAVFRFAPLLPSLSPASSAESDRSTNTE